MTSALTSVVPFVDYADDKMRLRYSHVVSGRYEDWGDIANRVVNAVVAPFVTSVTTEDSIFEMIRDRKFIPGGRILSQASRDYHQTDNCFCLRAENTREGWGDLANKVAVMSMSGGGCGVDYTDISPYGTPLKRSGGIASGPIPCIQMVDAILAAARQGGERRGAGYASLPWWHEDVDDFIKMKEDNNKLNHTNISVRFDNNFMDGLEVRHYHGKYQTFVDTLRHACQYGDPGFQFDWDDQTLRNACTEIISANDSDSCCIGSINLATINSLTELADVTNLAVLFLLCNTLYTDFPTERVRQVKHQNRRLGLGLMGVAEWFIQRGQSYGYVKYDEGENYIPAWLRTYQQTSDNAALHWSNQLNINRPVAVRAIAPTGTISIMGHTTPGIEPIFHTAYYRTTNTLKTKDYTDGFKRELVIDPIVSKLVDQGYPVEDIDTAYVLSQSTDGIERRLAFQAYVQQFVDNAISTTINLPGYVEGIADDLAPVVLRYLPQLRGLTFYPDGAKDHQPVVPVDIRDVGLFDQPLLDQGPMCRGGECGA